VDEDSWAPAHTGVTQTLVERKAMSAADVVKALATDGPLLDVHGKPAKWTARTLFE